MKLLHEELTGKIIEAFYNVYNKLGSGFLEGVYENSMMIELEKMDLSAKQQVSIKVYYKGKTVGNFFADIIVENEVIVELKAASDLNKAHEAQLMNYLKATKLEVGLLLNFGPKPKFIRKVFYNDYK